LQRHRTTKEICAKCTKVTIAAPRAKKCEATNCIGVATTEKAAALRGSGYTRPPHSQVKPAQRIAGDAMRIGAQTVQHFTWATSWAIRCGRSWLAGGLASHRQA